MANINREELEALLKASETDETALDNINIKLDEGVEKSLLQRANDESASRRIANRELKDKIKEMENAQQLVVEEKLKADGEIQKLLDIRTQELASIKDDKESLEKTVGEYKIKQETKRLALLEQLKAPEQELLKDSSEEVIQAFLTKQVPIEKSDAGADGFTSTPENTLNPEDITLEQISKLEGTALTTYVQSLRKKKKSNF